MVVARDRGRNFVIPRGSVRQRQAIAALVLWVLGIELLPGLHVAAHALLPAHHHGDADAKAWRVTETKRPDLVARGSQCHDHGGDSGHCHEQPAEAPDEDGDSPLEHGAGSLAHGQLALAAPPPPPILPRGTACSHVDVVGAPAFAARATAPRTVRQRGPPAAAPVS